MIHFRKALVFVWLIVAVVWGAVAAVPLVVDSAKIESVVPVCKARMKNSSCFACGLTTGFIAISEGEWDAASEANRASIPLFGGFVVNFAAAFVYSIRRLRSGGM